MSFPKYPSYLETHNPWIGKVPEHWNKTIAHSVVKEKYVPNTGTAEKNLLSLSFGRIVSKDINTNDGLLPQSFETYQIVEPQDIVFRPTDLQNDWNSLRSAMVRERGIITSAYIVIRVSNASPSFLSYLFRAYDHCKVFYSMGGGLRQAFKFSDIKRLPIYAPTIKEQVSISSFLDVETSKIDGLVSEQRRLIELLKEKRQAVISHAVTKGLNPNAPMKPSGIQWLGDVPEHWDVSKIKYECQYESGHTPSKSNPSFWIEEDCHIPWVSLNDTKTIDAADFIDDTNTKISEVGMANSSAHLIDAGAVVFTRDGARVGLSSITTKPMCVSQHIIAWVCGPRVSNHYLLHVIYAMNAEIYRITAGSTIPTIGMPDVKRMTMPLPPIDEQSAIVDFLVSERERFATLIAEAERAIELLQERRTALISATVTGKIDVREFASKEVLA